MYSFRDPYSRLCLARVDVGKTPQGFCTDISVPMDGRKDNNLSALYS